MDRELATEKSRHNLQNFLPFDLICMGTLLKNHVVLHVGPRTFSHKKSMRLCVERLLQIKSASQDKIIGGFTPIRQISNIRNGQNFTS